MVKRLILIITIILSFICSACSVNLSPLQVPHQIVSGSGSMSQKISDFMGFNGNERSDRTPFSRGEQSTANYIIAELLSYGFSEDAVEMHSFSITNGGSSLNGTTQMVVTSQNIIASYNKNATNYVIVGAHYDNAYSTSTGIYGNGSHGVSDNATGVCSLLSLAQAFMKNVPSIDFGVKFVFYGASEAGYLGSSKFLTDKVESLQSVLLAINLECISSNKIYVYADETETTHERLFLSASDGKTSFSKLPSTVPLMNALYTKKLPYSHYGQWSDSAIFYDAGIPTINIFGYDLDSLTYLSLAPDDLYSFTKDNIHYANAMSDTVNSVYSMLTSDDFLVLSKSFEKPADNISFWTKSAWAVIALVGLIIVLLLVLLLVVKHLGDKYPPTLPRAKRVKIAIFGIDYESDADGDNFVDIEKIGLDPFENHKNNDKNQKN